MLGRLRRALPPLIGLVLFVIALEVLHTELRATRWRELKADVLGIPSSWLALAFLLTAVNYAVLTGYDFLAFAYIRRKMPWNRVATVSFLAYAISNNIGLAMLSGASVRYRFYARWGVTAEELSRIVFSYSVTFWLGLLALGGLSLTVSPIPGAYGIPVHALLVFLGGLMMLAAVAYVVTTKFWHGPLRFWQFNLPLPPTRLALAQLGVSALDWALAGSVLYALLPPSGLSFLGFLGSFLAAILLGIASHVPGGVGVFEGLMVLLLRPYLSSAQLVPALVVYRVVYYLVPLSVALVGLVIDEVYRHRHQAARASAVLGRLTQQLTPRFLAFFTFLLGMMLLFSGATPSPPGRLSWLARLVPLGVIELSHFVGSVLGAVLLVISHGLWRRLDAAYYLTVWILVAGIFASLLKGLDYEEALLLALLLLILIGSRPEFERRASFFDSRFSVGWVTALLAAIGSSVWLGFFAFKHVNYSQDLWWQFELAGQVSRFLRASVGAAVVILLFGFGRLIRPAPPEMLAPGDADLAAASAVIASQRYTLPNLVFLRDKTLLFNESRTAFVMYGVQGHIWVSLGDPVGPEAQITEMIRLFLERCDDFGGIPVFYEVAKEHLHHYADFGLTFVKLGEEAKVDLRTFTLEGSYAGKYRHTIRKLEKEGGTFRIVEPPHETTFMSQLRRVSDDWLEEKVGAEKGFSLGFFNEEYLARFPIAVIERAGQIQAFANLWLGAQKQEMSIDLMRYHHEAPRDIMEALIVRLMKWGKEQGYQWFALGMAPLSGFEHSPVGSLWSRLGSFLYKHGERVYNFQGLRAYKEKFSPVWEARYLAYPGGINLPRILIDIAGLVSGGYRRIFLR
jgi:phosphatidylglycerol lysyltransferase